jgi:hypothetical protein
MDALTAIINRAMEKSVLSTYRGISAGQRISIYADDVAFFIRPTRLELQFVREALDVFGRPQALELTTRILRPQLSEEIRMIGNVFMVCFNAP